MSITPTESRTARALLDWTLTDLAKASLLGVSTIKNFETERHETTLANLAAIRGAFEKVETETIQVLYATNHWVATACIGGQVLLADSVRKGN